MMMNHIIYSESRLNDDDIDYAYCDDDDDYDYDDDDDWLQKVGRRYNL